MIILYIYIRHFEFNYSGGVYFSIAASLDDLDADETLSFEGLGDLLQETLVATHDGPERDGPEREDTGGGAMRPEVRLS